MSQKIGSRPNETGMATARNGDGRVVAPLFRLADFKVGDTVASVFGVVFIEARATGGYRVREVDPRTLLSTSSPFWMAPIATVFYLVETAADRKARAELAPHR